MAAKLLTLLYQGFNQGLIGSEDAAAISAFLDFQPPPTYRTGRCESYEHYICWHCYVQGMERLNLGAVQTQGAFKLS